MFKYGRVDICSLQQLLGHEGIATTEIYTPVDKIQLQAAVKTNPIAMMFNWVYYWLSTYNGKLTYLEFSLIST